MHNGLKILVVMVVLVVGNPVQAEPTGGIEGVARYLGKVPPAKKIPTADGGEILYQELIVDGKSKGLRYVLAVLEDAPAQPKLKNAEPAYVDQLDMAFIPRVVAVQHGQAVRFDNSDLCNHSVMAVSRIQANQFNRFVLPAKPFDHVFEPQKRIIPIGCTLHPWMKAWVYAAPHPWHAVSDEQGKFHIKAIPPGKYTLWLFHPDTGLSERREVVIEAGKTLPVRVEWKEIEK